VGQAKHIAETMPKSLGVLMIAPQFRPLVGGYERAAERLSEELTRMGHEVTVIADCRDKRWPRIETEKGFTLRRLWCIYRPGLHIFTALLSHAAFLLLHGRRYDVFHIHQYGHHAALTAVIGRLFRRPTILKITNTGAQGIEQALVQEQKASRLLGSLHRKVDACIATTVEAQAEAARFGIPRERIRIIPNGIDTDFFKPCDLQGKAEIKRRLGLGRPLTVLYSGRLSSAKNAEGLIEVWNAIYRHVPNTELVLIGDGPLREMLKLPHLD
jgi:glycosyltransferase involved in cell wall biosynthesis